MLTGNLTRKKTGPLLGLKKVRKDLKLIQMDWNLFWGGPDTKKIENCLDFGKIVWKLFACIVYVTFENCLEWSEGPKKLLPSIKITERDVETKLIN